MAKGYVTEYPYRVAFSSTSYLLVSMADIIGVAALFPLLSMLGGNEGEEMTGIGKYFFDLYSWAGVEPTIGWALLTIFVAITCKSLLTIAATVQVTYAAAFIGADIRTKMIKAHTRAKWSLYQSLSSGRLAAVISNEVQRVSESYLMLAKLIADFIRSSIHLAFAAVLAWEVTAAALGVGLLAVILLSRLMTTTRHEGRMLTQSMASFSTRLVDGLAGMKPLKAMAREDRLSTLLSWEISGIQKSNRKLGIIKQSIMAIQEPLMVAALAIGLYYMWEDWQNRMEIMLVLALVFLRSVQTLFSLQKNYQTFLQKEASYWLVKKLLREAEVNEEAPSGNRVPTFENTLSFDNVCFSYGEESIMDDANFTIETGTFVAIGGPSGTGKTTIIDLIIGLRSPDKGNVLIDGHPLKEYDTSEWRRMIGYVPQESFLFHESILANVTLGEADLTADDAVAALKAADAWDFISLLPEGIETIVGEHGSRFSGGQRQRIAIARALVHKPKLLVLDEATSALDPASEVEICKTLKSLSGSVTILAISHGKGIVEAADTSYRTGNGKLAGPEVSKTADIIGAGIQQSEVKSGSRI
jgi:ATP-binding cassette, subfamily C, bacterial